MCSSTNHPRFVLEQAPLDEAESVLLKHLAHIVDTAELLTDLRDLAPTIRKFFPEPAYLVGSGSSHIWIHRRNDLQRLVCIR
jgi:hypothetical protein